MKPYIKVTIESNDGETASTKSLTWCEPECCRTPQIINVVNALLEDFYPEGSFVCKLKEGN